MATTRKSLIFHTDNPRESAALVLLEKTQRKCTQLVALAVLEFAEKYGLHGKDQKDILQFIHNYDYICKNIENRPIQIIQSGAPYVGDYANTHATPQNAPHLPVQPSAPAKTPQISSPTTIIKDTIPPQRGPSLEEKRKQRDKLMAGFQVPDE